MRWFAWCLMAVGALVMGCDKPEETIPSVEPSSSSSGTTDSHDDDHGHDHGEGDHDHGTHEGAEGDEGHGDGEESAAKSSAEAVRFVADKSISVPGMMCPYSCWPKVKETLASQPGVEGVQLAEQPDGTAEGEIKERVVELKLSGDFDSDAAVAALSKINFDAEVVN